MPQILTSRLAFPAFCLFSRRAVMQRDCVTHSNRLKHTGCVFVSTEGCCFSQSMWVENYQAWQHLNKQRRKQCNMGRFKRTAGEMLVKDKERTGKTQQHHFALCQGKNIYKTRMANRAYTSGKDSPLMKPQLNSLDPYFYLDRHQIAHTRVSAPYFSYRSMNYSLSNQWKCLEMSYIAMLKKE